MNRVLRNVLIGVGTLVILGGGVVGGFLYKFNSETKKMHPIETGFIVDNIFAIKDEFVNMYLLRDGNNYIAIDTGKDINVISSELKKLNIDPDNVSTVLLTHTDVDHVSGLPLFKKASVYLAREETKMLTGEREKIFGYKNKISRSDYKLLDDQQVIMLGNEKSFSILTAGHTTGSICFLINGKYLFTGDILSLDNGKIEPSVKFLDLDHNMAMKSISKVTKLAGVKYLFTAHFGYTDDYQNAVKDWQE